MPMHCSPKPLHRQPLVYACSCLSGTGQDYGPLTPAARLLADARKHGLVRDNALQL